jgi:hypothetical protein
MKKLLLFQLVSSLIFVGAKAQSITDPFFDHCNFTGAFGSTDWTAGWANWDPQNTAYPAADIIINSSDTIKNNTVWTSNHTYLLNGWIYVKNNATLTIEPGTVIRGDYNNKGALIIERGSKLIAEGTSSQPIIFTSNEAPGDRDYGDWGGVILCGRATINIPGGTSVIEGGVGSIFGGGAAPDDNDSSGVLRFVRIEFPGVAFVQDKEINGLTFGGVGRKTIVDNIQVSYSGDDAFEWFGGTVNAKHLISLRTWDDDFDTDNGYRGMLQYGVCLRDPAIADPGSGSNGFESDNDKDGTTSQPLTSAVFSNFSMFGPKVTPSTTINANYKSAMHLRRSTSVSIYNSVFAGWKEGLKLEGSETEANCSNNLLNIAYTSLCGISGQNFISGAGSSFNLQDWFFGASSCNDTATDNSSIEVADPFNLNQPNFLPVAWSQLMNRTWLVCPSSGTADAAATSFSIGPNPAQNYVDIIPAGVGDLTGKIRLFDQQGKLLQEIYTGNFSADMPCRMHLENYKPGMYILSITTASSHNATKIILY